MKYYNASIAFVDLLNQLLTNGNDVDSRNGKVKELHNVTITIDNPTERCYLIPNRHDNIFEKIAETMWVLDGRNDIDWLSKYLPRAADYSDNGKTWRAGYGRRLRRWPAMIPYYEYALPGDVDPDIRVWYTKGGSVIDQVYECYKLLSTDPNTRRAVMSIWDPNVDYLPGKDIPCNDWLHFYIRDGVLYLNVAQRSSDIMWGFSGTNTFEWSVLQEAMASWLDVKVGPFTYFISSLHLYETHWDRAPKLLVNSLDGDAATLTYVYNNIKSCAIHADYNAFHNGLQTLMTLEGMWWNGQYNVIPAAYIDDPFMAACANMLRIYAYLHNTSKTIDSHILWNMMEPMEGTDFLWAAKEYIIRPSNPWNTHKPG